MALDVDLGPRLEGVVSNLVSQGRYSSETEALREAVRLLEAREKQLVELDAALEVGLAQSRAGLSIDLDEAFDRLEAKFHSRVTGE